MAIVLCSSLRVSDLTPLGKLTVHVLHHCLSFKSVADTTLWWEQPQLHGLLFTYYGHLSGGESAAGINLTLHDRFLAKHEHAPVSLHLGLGPPQTFCCFLCRCYSPRSGDLEKCSGIAGGASGLRSGCGSVQHGYRVSLLGVGEE